MQRIVKRIAVPAMLAILAAAAPWLAAQKAAEDGAKNAEKNLVRNPGFEVDRDRDGVPDHWAWAGDRKLVAQTLATDRRRGHGRCARLECTRLEAGNPAAHAMICQMGVPVVRGRPYRLTLWARGRVAGGEVVSVALSDTSRWAGCGLRGSFAPTDAWQPFTFAFEATRTCSTKTRLQFWFGSTGTLWLDDVELVEAGRDLYHPGHIVPPGRARNLIPNASFECGGAGWGSADWPQPAHWGGPMNRLFGAIDPGVARHGRASLRIELTPENRPVSFFDYYDLYRTPVLAPLAASIGHVPVDPDSTYVVSAWVRAARENTPVRLAVRMFRRGHHDRRFVVGRAWQRIALPFKPWEQWCYVLVGPDLRETNESPAPPESATVWIDAVQLEKARTPGEFSPRQEVELAVSTNRTGNVFTWDEPVVVHVSAVNHGAKKRDVAAMLRLTDFRGAEAWKERVTLSVPAGRSVTHAFTVPTAGREPLRGFYRLTAAIQGDKQALPDAPALTTLRLAVIPGFDTADSRFGVNHAYSWPHLLDLSRRAGLLWVRDWSLKWKDVEPVRGKFTFTECDHQIDRPLAHGLKVLAMLPFPSSEWSSEAAGDAAGAKDYVARRAVCARAPGRMADFERYAAKTVAHYRDRVVWFQVFNEPLYTSYALPRAHGYDGATYAKYVAAFTTAARRVHPGVKVLAGIGAISDGQILQDFEAFFAAGGLRHVDAVDIHHYPRIRPPEFIEPLLAKLNALMDAHGGRKPIWCTEYGYYADDDPWAVPLPNSGFNQPLGTELQQAAYAVRWAVLLFSGGVDKIFYHAGTCDGVNRDSLQGIFYEYAGEPHLIYAAQAVMSRLLTPSARFVKKLEPSPGVRCHVFADNDRHVAVLWSTAGARPRPVTIRSDRIAVQDLMGRPVKTRRIRPSPTPVYLVAEGIGTERFLAGVR